MLRHILNGAAAGAAGTTALNTATYLDMALRGRPASDTPSEAVERISDKAHVPVPGEGEERGNRVSGLGPLLGVATGVGVGAAYGATRALGWKPPLPLAAAATAVAAMAGADAPMAALGLTDPRDWQPADWLSDAVPHLVYGMVTAAVYAAADR